MRNLLPSLSGGKRGNVGREKDASETLLSELTLRMDVKTAEKAAATQRGQERRNRAGEGKVPQDQIWHPRRGKNGMGRAKTSGCPVAAEKAEEYSQRWDRLEEVAQWVGPHDTNLRTPVQIPRTRVKLCMLSVSIMS